MAFDLVRHFQKFDFSACHHVVVAVSGGSDSVGLLCALKAYFNSLPASPKLSAVTVDHSMRAGSAREAANVAALCAVLNVPHVIKTWIGAKPISGIQAAARHERRVLLCLAASELGGDVILTGHTMDDQIETVLMRQKRGAGPGLAGIGWASLGFDDRTDGRPIWIVRPMLDLSRNEIRSYLIKHNISWVEDPSNENLAFERIEVRNALKSSSAAFGEEILDLSAATARKRVKVDGQAATLLNAHAHEVVPGLVHLNSGVFPAADSLALTVLLRTLIAYAGASPQLGDGNIAEEIIGKAAEFGFSKGMKPWRKTSSGALIEIRQSGMYFLRERRKRNRHAMNYDGFYRITGAGRPVEAHTKAAEALTVPVSLLRQAQELQPIYDAQGSTPLPAFDAAIAGYPVRRLINPWPDLVPIFDIELAARLSVLACAGDFPALPVYRHGKN